MPGLTFRPKEASVCSVLIKNWANIQEVSFTHMHVHIFKSLVH